MLFCWFVFTYKQIGISETLKFGKYFWFHSNGTYSKKNYPRIYIITGQFWLVEITFEKYETKLFLKLLNLVTI